jgi:hypothetical protein
MRTIELAMDGDAIQTVIEAGDRHEFHNAIGYLAIWGSNPENAITKVLIGIDWNAPDLVAHYYKEDGTRVFTMGAVYRPNQGYSFHS